MKKLFRFGAIALILNQCVAQAYLVDAIRVVIYSEESTSIITLSDINRPSLEGTKRSLDDIILEQLIYADAKKYKVVPEQDEVDRHLLAVQKDHNLTLDQLKDVFKVAGYSYEEGRAQFAVMTTVNSMLDFKIRSRLMVPDREVQAYYTEHPEMLEAEYKLVTVLVPYAEDKDAQYKKLKKPTPAVLSGLNWSEPFWIKHSELAEDKQFIPEMKLGQISVPQETEHGFELFRLVDLKKERLKPLEERYEEIIEQLRKPRFETLFNEYKKELFDHASIVYFD